MITLGKIERYADNQTFDIERTEADMFSLYKSSGLEAAIVNDPHGWLTAEPTTGVLNYNPNRKLCAVRYYENEPHTRRGYYAKLQVMPNGDLRSK